jgi:nitrogen fixation NifU-like protein
MDNLRELYQQVIIDHSRNPRNFDNLNEDAKCANGFNPLCGDKLRLCVLINNDHTITDIRFKGEGCAISTASASILTETLTGKTVAQAQEIFDAFQNMLVHEAEPTESLGKLSILQGVAEFPSRIKCATLAWHALIAALHDKTEASTE